MMAMRKLPCDGCLALGGVELIVVDPVHGCRHNLPTAEERYEAFQREQTVEFIERTT